MLNDIGKNFKYAVLVYLLTVSLSSGADALDSVTGQLQQQNAQLSQENNRLQLELKRLRTKMHCESAQAPSATLAPPNQWLFISEQYGLPIIGF